MKAKTVTLGVRIPVETHQWLIAEKERNFKRGTIASISDIVRGAIARHRLAMLVEEDRYPEMSSEELRHVSN